MGEVVHSPPEPRPPSRAAVVFALALAVGVILYASARAVGKSYDGAFFSIPFFMGFVAGLASTRRPYSITLLALLAGCLVGIVTLREGVVCVLFALPLIVPEALLGTLAGTVVRRWVVSRRARQGTGVGMVAAAIGWQALSGALDDPARHPVHRATSSVIIAEPPSVVFAALTARPVVVAQSWQWFLRIGLPMAKRLEVLEPRVGGRATMELSFGTAHARITEFDPPRVFAFRVERYDVHDPPFHITRLGRSPNYGLHPDRIDDWLTILSTRYTFEALPSGGTRLSRTVVWRRHLAPGLYFAPLQQTILERGQNRLLTLIRDAVQGAPLPPPGEPVVLGRR